MKIRQGFVSNSSSTSFCLYGFFAEWYELDAVLNRDTEPTPEDEDSFYKDGDGWKKQEDITDKASRLLDYKKGLYVVQAEDGLYVGGDPTAMKDDMTMGEWKKQVKAALKKYFKKIPKASKPEFITDTASTG